MEIKLANKNIKLDFKQIEVFSQLENLQRKLIKITNKNQGRLAIKKIFVKPKPITNLYIYGDVGRGKSMLMRHFFDNLPLQKKVYFHFNDFMQKVHKELHKLRKIKSHQNHNLLELATTEVIGVAKILCFDEMQVEDVADAMILQGVFTYFIQNQITVITTSNRHPLELYDNVLQRDLFLKFINETFLNNFLLLNLDSEIDYRSQFVNSKQHYFFPINSKNKQSVLEIFEKITDKNKPVKREIELLGRKISIAKTYKNIALFDFKELCETDLGVADYQAICKEFSLIFLLNVPILKPENRNEAKRLIWFIDEAYENKVNLVVLANAKPDEIYVKGIGAKAFKRTASRLNEIG